MNSNQSEQNSTAFVNRHVGQRIRLRRDLRGLTQSDLAVMCQISPQQVHKYESGQSSLTIARALMFARALRVPVVYFYEDLEVADTHEGLPPRLRDLLLDRGAAELLKLMQDLDPRTRAGLAQFLRSLPPSAPNPQDDLNEPADIEQRA